ncbi:hypothetical protein GDO86_008965 [Hymenochirus boettgeri]|uniref:tRNA (32-2'-O)-methyltransferase regulator THADA n=1 Tax=Hymenochirus boettgeri TaxID=247094 RepID=A0A8T2JM91_9PIPI|nr:hypothetical protein GDO86_008965 [Hymenochirus boettgeri]
MVLKKKKEIKVDVLVFDGPIVERLKGFVDEKEQNIPSLLLHCLQLQDGVQQIHCIKQIASLMGNLSPDYTSPDMVHCCLDVLTEMYFSLNSKNPLKKVLASSLSSVPDQYKPHVVSCFTHRLAEDIATEDPIKYRQVVDGLASCLENFTLGTTCVTSLFVESLQFLEKVLRTFQSQNRKILGNGLAQTQLMYDLLTAVKLSMVLVQKAQGPIQSALQSDLQSPAWRSLCELLSRFTDLVLDANLLQNVQSTSAMAGILYMRTMVKDPEKLPKLVSVLILSSADPGDLPDWVRTCCGSLYNDPPGTVVVYMCQGALAMLDWKNGNLGESGEELLLGLLTVLLHQSSRLKESSAAMLLSRVLALWTGSALDVLTSCSSELRDQLNGCSSAMGKLLDYVYIHWEHPLDAVRHQTKLVFKNLLQIHRMAVGSDEAEDSFLSDLAQSLLNLEWHSKGKYASLACLVDCVGSERILAVDRTIPSQILDVMGDQSFAPYASNLLEAMFINHKNQLASRSEENCWLESWHNTWVSPLLSRLCEDNIDQTTYIIDYYLPKLLKFSPESLNYMIDILQASASTSLGSGNSRGALGALMACLRTARTHGYLRFTENYEWNGKASTLLIQQSLVHRHDQVRVDALGLLCESHWSTEVVSLDEMNLVLFSLKYNLNCQSPSIRQQFCYLLKKLFCRIQESSQVLFKVERGKKLNNLKDVEIKGDPTLALQQYREFMVSITNCLFGSLFAGSSHPTRFSSLTILGAICEIFPEEKGSCHSVFQFVTAVGESHVQVLLECISNTFEEVKILAFDLLIRLPPSVLALKETSKLLPLVQAAMSLSTSTKHFDCVTASYLLNFLIYQQALLSALESWDPTLWAQIESRPGNIDCLHFIERNSFSVIRCLMSQLGSEIEQAERSLLQAAASFPMYGRVHCIIRLLKQLSLRELSMVSEWRKLISELISMSYRLSAVVSPVVHSSSPEGLMPMDMDTEAAVQLHMIMNEIQPRDTNDFFTQPRLLQKDPHSQPLPEDTVPATTLCAEMKGDEVPSGNVTAQMVLVCCWRSMKEVSLLLGMLCQSLPLQEQPHSPAGLLTVDQVKEMGEYFKHHLLQSRHRGAFELAYVGFAKLTEMLIGCREESLHCLPKRWLCSVLEEIKSSDPSSKLCATRRSAGIPFYIQALLASEPKNSKAGLLKMTMNQLIALAMPEMNDESENKSTIPQVHALNILRALFRDTRLGENVIPYIADGTQSAILGFTSPVWAVRNSSTLLFSTLITRIFGVKRGKDERSKKNRMTGREFFSRFSIPLTHFFLNIWNLLPTLLTAQQANRNFTLVCSSLFLILTSSIHPQWTAPILHSAWHLSSLSS